MDEIFLVNSCSFQIVEVSSSIIVAPNVVVDLTQAATVTGSFSGPAQGLTGVSASYIVPTANTTASYSDTASWAVNAINGGTQLLTGSTYPITASWSDNSVSSSYVSGAYSYINDLSSSTITVNNGAKVGGMSEGLASVNTVQIAATDVGVPLPDASYKRDGAVQIGWGAGQSATTAGNAVAIGIQAGTNTKLADNAVQIGALAGAGTITASNAVQIGPSAGQISIDATNAVQIGNAAGVNATTAIQSVQIGSSAGFNARTGSYTTFIGSGADTLNANLNVEKSIALGYNAKVSGSNMAVIGGTGADAVSVGIGTNSPQNTLEVVGNIKATSITASLQGTSSWSNDSIYSISASHLIPGSPLHLSNSYIQSAASMSAPAWKEGRLFWDKINHTYAIYNDRSDVTLQIGQEEFVHAMAGEVISNGNAVYISGSAADPEFSSSNLPIIYNAIADGTGTKNSVIGLTTHAFVSGAIGWVTVSGKVNDLNTSGFVDGDLLWLSSTTPGAVTNVEPGQPYETVQVGYCVFSDASLGKILVSVQVIPAPSNAYAGMTSVPVITDLTASSQVGIGSGSVNLYKTIDGSGAITQYPVNEVTFSIVAGFDASFVYATTNGTTASYELTSDFNDINGTTKVLVTTLYRADEDAHWMELKSEGLALANKLNIRLMETEKFAWESGFTLIPTGSNYLSITEGQIWFGASNISQQAFDSFNTQSVSPKYETHWAYHSASVWTIPIQTDGKWNSGYYDNGTNLIALGPDSWSIHYVYRILGENPFDEDIFLVTSNYQYSTFGEAQADTLPAGIPSVLDDVSIMVGRLVFQSGSTTATAETSFTTNFGQSTVTQHNSLGGLQGGQGGEYYHLTSGEYIGTGTGNVVRASNASMNGTIITNARLTGSLLGNATTASFVVVAQTASFVYLAESASFVATASNVGAATYITLAQTASFVQVAQTVVSVSTASWANTASWAINAINGGTQLYTGSTYPITSSWSVTASFAANAAAGSGTTLYTGSTYPITSSWSDNSISASYAPMNNPTSASIAAADSGKQNTLVTGNTYTITSSWSANSVSSSYAPVDPSYSSSVATGLAGKQNTLITGDTYAITSSWAANQNPTSASIAAADSGKQNILVTGGTYTITSSWSANSVSSSYAPTDSGYSASVATGLAGKQNTLIIGDTYTITSSWSANSTSASYAPIDIGYSASVATGLAGKQNTLITGDTYLITSSWSDNAISASYAPTTTINTFSRGGTFYDPYGIAGQAANSQSVYVWRAPFNCTATAIYGIMDATTGANITTSLTAWHNDNTMLTTPISITSSHVWVGNSPGSLISASFLAGDSLQITLLTCSAVFVTSSAIQVDFTKP